MFRCLRLRRRRKNNPDTFDHCTQRMIIAKDSKRSFAVCMTPNPEPCWLEHINRCALSIVPSTTADELASHTIFYETWNTFSPPDVLGCRKRPHSSAPPRSRSCPLSLKFSGEVCALRSSRRRRGLYVRVSTHTPTYRI